MQPESSISVYLIASIILSVLGIMLIGFHIRVERKTFNLRLSRAFMVCAYFMLAIALFLSHVYQDGGDIKFNVISTPVVSALQSMFFTFTLLSILLPTYITRRQILWHVTIVCGAVILYLVAAFSIENYHIVVIIGVLSYICLLIFYTRLFIKKYALSLRQLEDYYDEDEQGRLRWVQISFYAALSLGIIASVSAYFPFKFYVVFVMIYITFYAWFAIRFINFLANFDFYLSATTNEPEQLSSELLEEMDSDKETLLKKSLKQWVLDEGYTKGDISTAEVAKFLGTDLLFLRSYFRKNMPCDFRTWRNELRIRKAQELIAANPAVSINQIAQQVGFVTQSNFYLYFKKITGHSPADYRDQMK